MALSLALLRMSELSSEAKDMYPNEKELREHQVTALLGLTIFTVFVQVRTYIYK